MEKKTKRFGNVRLQSPLRDRPCLLREKTERQMCGIWRACEKGTEKNEEYWTFLYSFYLPGEMGDAEGAPPATTATACDEAASPSPVLSTVVPEVQIKPSAELVNTEMCPDCKNPNGEFVEGKPKHLFHSPYTIM